MNPVYKKYTKYTLDLYQGMQRRSVKLACISPRVILARSKKNCLTSRIDNQYTYRYLLIDTGKLQSVVN